MHFSPAKDRYSIASQRAHSYPYSGYPHHGLDPKKASSQLEYDLEPSYQNEVNLYEYSYTESSTHGDSKKYVNRGGGGRRIGMPRRYGERVWWPGVPLPVLNPSLGDASSYHSARVMGSEGSGSQQQQQQDGQSVQRPSLAAMSAGDRNPQERVFSYGSDGSPSKAQERLSFSYVGDSGPNKPQERLPFSYGTDSSPNKPHERLSLSYMGESDRSSKPHDRLLAFPYEQVKSSSAGSNTEVQNGSLISMVRVQKSLQEARDPASEGRAGYAYHDYASSPTSSSSSSIPLPAKDTNGGFDPLVQMMTLHRQEQNRARVVDDSQGKPDDPPSSSHSPDGVADGASKSSGRRKGKVEVVLPRVGDSSKEPKPTVTATIVLGSVMLLIILVVVSLYL